VDLEVWSPLLLPTRSLFFLGVHASRLVALEGAEQKDL
jgi:hypothetical protein